MNVEIPAVVVESVYKAVLICQIQEKGHINMKYCAICNRPEAKGAGSFFRIPKDERRRALWNNVCGMTLTNKSVLCANHFSPSDTYSSGNKSLLMPNAIPTVDIERTTRQPEVTITNRDSQQEDSKSIASGAGYNQGVKNSSDHSQYIELINEEMFDENNISQNEEANNEVIDYFSDGASANQTEHKLDVLQCGLVTFTSVIKRYYYLNCSDCSQIFPIYKWEEFCDHIEQVHRESNEEPRNTYLDDDRSSPVDKCETRENSAPPNPLDITPIANSNSSSESAITGPMEPSTLSDSSCDIDKADRESSNMDTIECPDLSPTNEECNYVQEDQNINCYQEFRLEDRIQIDCNEIRFGKTKSSIVIDFLKRLKRFPSLWHTASESMDAYETDLEEIIKEMNSQWSLRLTKLVLRNNLESIKHYYNSVLENCKQYNSYYPKYKEYLKICAEIPNENDNEKDALRKKELLMASLVPNPGFGPQRPTGKKKKYFTCSICDRGFHFEFRYKDHLKLHSEEIRKYKCDTCGRNYLTESALNQHKKRHDPPKYVCKVCSKSYSYAPNLEMHMKIHTKTFDHVCEWCGKGFVDKKGYLTHVKFKHNDEGRCSICKHTCQTAAALEKHLITRHRPLTISEDFKRVITHQTVKRNKEKNFNVKRRDKRPGRYQWSLDPETGKRRVHCTDCDKSYTAYDTLYVHISKIHGYEPARESFISNQIRKPNQSHCEEKKFGDSKIRGVNTTENDDINISDTELVDINGESSSDTSCAKLPPTELSLTNTENNYDTSDLEEVDNEYDLTIDEGFKF